MADTVYHITNYVAYWKTKTKTKTKTTYLPDKVWMCEVGDEVVWEEGIFREPEVSIRAKDVQPSYCSTMAQNDRCGRY
jgi:hypothetical protein